MKLVQKQSQKTSGNHSKNNKLSKKNKSQKKISDKTAKDSKSNTFQEKNQKQEVQNSEVKEEKIKKEEVVAEEIKAEDVIKALVDKRKQDGNEWKALKKADYQRLETVVEEGQLSSEESPTKGSSPEEQQHSDTDRELKTQRMKKPKTCTTVTAKDQLVKTSKEEEEERKHRENKQPQTILELKPHSSEKSEESEFDASHGDSIECESKESEGRLSLEKRSLKGGIIEILPIFSNHKFVCSKDAISIDEYEDLDPLVKNSSDEQKSPKESAEKDGLPVKPFLSTKNVRKKDGERVAEESRGLNKIAGNKEQERKLRHKLLTDVNGFQRLSSPFINSVFVLTPFAKELEERSVNFVAHPSSQVKASANINFPEIETIPAVILTTVVFFTICLGLAWRSYQPPRMLDYILQFIPFLQRRRTLTQLFFDSLIRIVSNGFAKWKVVNLTVESYSVLPLCIYSMYLIQKFLAALILPKKMLSTNKTTFRHD